MSQLLFLGLAATKEGDKADNVPQNARRIMGRKGDFFGQKGIHTSARLANDAQLFLKELAAKRGTKVSDEVNNAVIWWLICWHQSHLKGKIRLSNAKTGELLQLYPIAAVLVNNAAEAMLKSRFDLPLCITSRKWLARWTKTICKVARSYAAEQAKEKPNKQGTKRGRPRKHFNNGDNSVDLEAAHIRDEKGKVIRKAVESNGKAGGFRKQNIRDSQHDKQIDELIRQLEQQKTASD